VIVVDTNVVAHLWIPGERTAVSERLLRHDPAWAAPLLWRSELQSVLAGWMRRGRLDLAGACRIAAAAGAHLRGREFAVATERVLRLVAGSVCSAYDCEFAALAEELGVPLVTADRELLRAFPGLALAPERLLGR
jgi:predicted nucleic acid-binding protein